MKSLRIIHTADWHSDNDPVKQQKLSDSLEQILEYVKVNPVNALIHAGDIWEKKQTYSDKSGVPVVIKYLREISKHVDFIFITKGNNSHDEPGSVKLLHQLEPNIHAYEYPVCLAIKGNELDDMLRWEDVSYEVVEDFDYIISLFPYPTKALFLTDQSIDLNNDDFIKMFEQTFELIGDTVEPYNCPKILAFHGNVVGSRLSSGQTLVSQDIMVAPSSLKKAKQDYYALGHIHLRQEVAPDMVYSGSIYNKSWGETEEKSFEVIEFDGSFKEDGMKSTETVPLKSARPMQKIEAVFTGDSFKFDGVAIPQAETRFRITLEENQKKLLTEEKFNWIKKEYGDDVKIELSIIPDQRESRSEKIMTCKSLLDEVEEYAQVTDQYCTIDVSDSEGDDRLANLPETIKDKVLSLQGEGVLL